MSGKATTSLFETAGGASVQRLALEVFPGFWAYVYAVQMNDYCVLIDCGSGTDASHQNLLTGLARVGVQPSELTHIFITHAHIDHFGGLTGLRPLTGAQIVVHELDVQTIAHHEARQALIGRRLASFLSDSGLAQEAREQILSMYRFTKSLYRSVPVDLTCEAIGMRLGPFEFMHLPGHCPGHVAIRLDDVVFCGDMVVEGVTPHLVPETLSPYSGLDHYLDSLARFAQRSDSARLVLNGHDEAITDLPAQIESTGHNILRRLKMAIEALDVPRTVAEVCKAVYGEMSGYNQMLIIEKMGAYLEYLYEHGLIEITNAYELEQGLPARYRRLRDESALVAEVERSVNMYTGIQVRT
jgi:glyoxylase-like metal-dependent hydrolase (beta-lactamase superfamily II)